MTQRLINFSAGPATLPLKVLEEAQRDLASLPGVGMSILEVSHRSKCFSEVLARTEANLRRLLDLSDDFAVLFLQGGASLQFSMTPMNLLRGSGKPADYVSTGSWAKKAIKEAKREGDVHVAWDGASGEYRRVPKPEEMELSSDPAYVHYTSNETIQGVQFPEPPTDGVTPLVCDASSDFLSRPLPMERFGLVYAGAQKNAGPAGVTIVLIRKELLERVPADLHTMLSYRAMAEGGSVYNTPPCFAIYVVMLITQWLLDDIGGLDAMAALNAKKATLLYEEIGGSDGFYKGHADADSRSTMNVVWRLPSETLEKEFVAAAQALGLDGLKGHRSVGGIRASIYNAMPFDGVRQLRDFMREFRETRSA